MVLHVRRMPKHNEGNLCLRGNSVKLCPRGELLGCMPKVSQCPTSIRNVMAYEYINMDNIQSDETFWRKNQKQNHENLGKK